MPQKYRPAKFVMAMEHLIKLNSVRFGGRDSSVGIATTLRAGRSGDRIPVWARFSAPFQIGPGAYPLSYTMGTGSFPVGKAAGAWC